MARYTVEGTAEEGFLPREESDAAAIMLEIDAGMLGSKEQIQDEIDLMVTHVRRFFQMEPDEVMEICSAYSARLTELALLLHRVEGRDRQYKQVRTMQVQRLEDELDRQFKIHSRLLEVRRQDIDMTRGSR